jgi:hypothetical protein
MAVFVAVDPHIEVRPHISAVHVLFRTDNVVDNPFDEQIYSAHLAGPLVVGGKESSASAKALPLIEVIIVIAIILLLASVLIGLHLRLF